MRSWKRTATPSLFLLFLLSVSVIAQGDFRLDASSISGWQWPASSNGITYIPVCWENPGGSQQETGWVRSKILSTWGSVANVNFYGWGTCQADSRGIRILIADTRSNSGIGRFMDGVRNGMELNFTFRNFSPSCQAAERRPSCITSVALHEFGHALGLMHEQDRADSTCKTESRKTGGLLLTEYDPNSVMNYCNPRWNNDGVLSALDVVGIQRLYGKRAAVPAPAAVSGSVTIKDTLNVAAGQRWEYIVMTLGTNDSRRDFRVDTSKPTASATYSFTTSGRYCFKLWSNTLYADGKYYDGYGEGCWTLEAGRSYAVEIRFRKGTRDRYFDIVLE